MKILKAYKYKLEPTVEQAKKLALWTSHLRGLYNLALDHRILNYQQFRKSMNYYDQANELPSLKIAAPWIAEVPSQCLQQTLKDVERAYKNFFKSGFGFPKFRKRMNGGSMRFPDAKQFSVSTQTRKRKGFLKLPKIGVVKFVNTLEILGEIKNCTISLTPTGKFFVSIQVEENVCNLTHKKLNSIGIDRGVHQLGMTSEGEILELPIEKLNELDSKLKTHQRKLSKKVKGSKNFHKARIRVAKLHEKIVNVRKDSLHKITSQLAKNHSKVAMEDLKIKNMTASAKGTLAEPGKKVAQKSGLNRSILQQGLGEFERQLSYKLLWSGGSLLKVKPHFTSQTCNKCGHVAKENRKKLNFCCVSCGNEDHADINAAKNILALGHSVSVCGEASVGLVVKPRSRRVSLKQKPSAAQAAWNPRPLGRGGCQ